jgi:hypothetical protein
MKIIKILLVLSLIILVACTKKLSLEDTPPKHFLYCQSDHDCIPRPGCHPKECINFKYANEFVYPNYCTSMYMCGAAYKGEDCICKNNSCVNKKNIEGDPSCMI